MVGTTTGRGCRGGRHRGVTTLAAVDTLSQRAGNRPSALSGRDARAVVPPAPCSTSRPSADTGPNSPGSNRTWRVTLRGTLLGRRIEEDQSSGTVLEGPADILGKPELVPVRRVPRRPRRGERPGSTTRCRSVRRTRVSAPQAATMVTQNQARRAVVPRTAPSSRPRGSVEDGGFGPVCGDLGHYLVRRIRRRLKA
jgi:hypothetical protein